MGENKDISYTVMVTSHTWARDSHDLYDYETDTYHVQKQKLSTSSLVLRDKINVFPHPFLEARDNIGNIIDHLFTIKVKENPQLPEFEVSPAEKGRHLGLNLKKLWRIVRFLPEQKYTIQENDIIKLGRCKLIVRQLIPAKESNLKLSPMSLNYEAFRSVEASLTIREMENHQCRICLIEGGTEEDPLVKACSCKGSIEFLHVRCLEKWYQQKQDLIHETSNIWFCLKLMRCELCKHPLPVAINRNKTPLLRLFKIPQNIIESPPLIVLENMIGNNPRAYHIISIHKQLKLGRGHECDVRIPDVSISRHHATINYENNRFTIQDEKSKFGTLVSLKQPLHIRDQEKLILQAGRSVVKVQALDNRLISESAEDTTTLF